MRSSDWRSDVCSSDLQVVAKLGFYRALHNIDGCAEYDLVEFLDHLAGAESTQVAAVATRGAAGVLARNFGKVGAPFDGGLDRTRVVWGQSVSARVDRGGRRQIKKQKSKITKPY